MVITNKRLKIPESFKFGNLEINCVSEFKLLGVTIDNKLNFNSHITNISHCINSKLFSIKRIFYLSTSVKIQFFKTFILPYFDYCLTLLIYFNKTTIQRLCNKYYLCLYKLFKFDIQDFSNYIELNQTLQDKYDIPAFQHRLFQRVSVLCFKKLNFKSVPKTLQGDICANYLELSSFELNPLHVPETIRNLRNRAIYNLEILTKYKQKTFSYFSYLFLKCFDLNIFNLPFKNFLLFYNEYSNIIYTSLTKTFTYFNLDKKHFTWIKALS